MDRLPRNELVIGHRVQTTERQGGFLAFCEVEIEGAVHLCTGTGIYTTRTEARQALVHEKGPGVRAPGQRTEPLREETIIMSISEPTETVISGIVVNVGHLGIYFVTDPDSAPELTISDGQHSITVGPPETARALGGTLMAVAPPTAAMPRSEATLSDDLERALAEAQATECGVPGCDRELHDPGDDPSEWVHRIAHRRHFGMDVDLCVEPEGTVLASLFLKIEDSFDAEGLRSLATTLQLQAAALLEDADILEQRARRALED